MAEADEVGIETARLRLVPLPQAAAAALPGDRAAAAAALHAALDPAWPQPDLYDVLPRHARAAPADLPWGAWAIVERATASVIGDAGFFGPPAGDGTVEVGYSIVPGRRRLGLATEAVGALVAWARAQPRVTRVVAGCDPGNLASIRTLERLGFARDGAAGGELRWRLP